METDKKYFMVIETSDFLHRLEANQFNLFTQKLHNGIAKSLKSFNGEIIKHNDNMYVACFDSVTDSILCALKVQSNFKYITPKFDKAIRQLHIGIACNEELATRICEITKDQLVISKNVKFYFEKENKNTKIDNELIRTLKSSETLFLNNLMSFLKSSWNNAKISIDDFSKPLNYSKSQVYRKIVSITGKTPSEFLKTYRLKKALELMRFKNSQITEIAKQTGFKSGSYFSKCFKEHFNILPSKYLQQHT